MSKHSVRKKLFLNYHYEFVYQLVASERKTFISIYHTSQPNIYSISLKGHVLRNAFRRPIHFKKCKNLQEGLQKHKNKIVEIRTSIIQNLTQSITWGTRRQKKNPATIMRLAPIFQFLAPTCLMIHKFGCNECTKKTLSETTYLTLNLILG